MNAPIRTTVSLEPRPLYGIGTVARLTGLKSDTLRCGSVGMGWERAISRLPDDVNTRNLISITCNWCRLW